MGIFTRTFRPNIVSELKSRKSHHDRQSVYHPTGRVTSLIQGQFADSRLRNLTNQKFRGFTLGPQDLTDANTKYTLDQLTNISGNGSVIGTTYTNNEPQPVRIKSKKNLPSPGVTDISITTQSKGGLIFKATVNFKFYGKEQYDVLYQLFMRPGNPILIEYGHTQEKASSAARSAPEIFGTKRALNDLDFFRDLADVSEYEDDLRQNSKILKGRLSGAVVGLVSNFKIGLNEENEYEATIELINALEYLFTLPQEETFLAYAENASLSNSIKANFGYMQNEEYKPEYDRVFQFLLRDTVTDIHSDRLISRIFKKHFINLGYASNNIGENTFSDFGDDVSDTNRDAGLLTQQELRQQADSEFDQSYVNFNYFINRLLGVILFETINLSENCDFQNSILFATAAQREQLASDFRNLQTQQLFQDLNFDSSNEAFYEEAGINEKTFMINVAAETLKYFPTLRSNSLQNVLINNENLYIPDKDEFIQIWGPSIDAYEKKFKFDEIEGADETIDISDRIKETFFKTSRVLNNKATYGESTPFDGIFINYQTIRNSFLNSNSVSEAIVRILNEINSSTTGLLKLKLRYTSNTQAGGMGPGMGITYGPIKEFSMLTIYNENNMPSKSSIPDLYTFFEDDVSEAIAYNFDFSLPSSVASTVIANNFTGIRPENVVGDAQSDQLIRNGYDIGLKGLIGATTSTGDDKCQSLVDEFFKVKIADNSEEGFFARFFEWVQELWLVQRFAPDDGEIEQLARQFAKQYGEVFGPLLAYKDFCPDATKGNAIANGLLNTLPTSARVSIKLVGVDGFRFGDMFSVEKVLPRPYDKNNIFMLTGYKHDITSEGWFTTIDGTMIGSTPTNKLPPLPDIKITPPAIDPEEAQEQLSVDFEEELQNQTIIVPDIS